MTKRLRASLMAVLGVAMAVCLLFGALQLLPKRAFADTAESVSHATVAVHDPSIVLAYEGEDGKAYPDRQTAEQKYGGGSAITKTYYVFGTQLSFARSTDLVNWTPFETNLHVPENLSAMLTKEADYSGHGGNATELKENCWAPDVIWNKDMQKWCMYLTVNGKSQKSVIVLLVADDLDGVWSYVGGVVYSRIGADNIAATDYEKATGKTTVDPKYAVYRNNSDNLLYGVNAIDAAVTYDDEGNLWMVYGSWFGGIYMLRLDPQTGLRDYDYKYENKVLDGNGEDITGTAITQSAHPDTFKVVSDEYLGIHIAGGHHAPEGGEGPYIEKIGEYYYLFLSYGGYAPNGEYNMRVFRSEEITGPYVDAAERPAIFTSAQPDVNANNSKPNGLIGNRLMTGYTWSWWDFSYVSQGHNSAFVDEDGRAYLVYHNKYMDGTVFHVMKVHELLVNGDGWLVVSPFESDPNDSVAKGLEKAEIAGDYGVLFMQRNNGKYGTPVTEEKYTLTADGKVTGHEEGTWDYDPENGAIALTFTFDGKSTVHKGYLLNQTLEGTNIQTLAFTAVSPDPRNDKSVTYQSVRTYWGYKYPDATQAGQYVANEYALPDAMGEGADLPGDVTSTLWNGVTVTYAKEDGKIAAKAGGTTLAEGTLAETQDFLRYGKVGVNRKFFKVNSATGVSISFDYKDYQSDWTEVLAGDTFRINLSVLERAVGGKWGAIFEGAAGGDYTAFFGSGRATISFNTDGTIAFYRDGALQMRFGAALPMSENAGTAQDLCNDVLAAFKEGKVRAAYPMENVVIAAAIGGDSVYDAVPYLTFTDPSIKVIGTVTGSASGTAIPAVADAEANGFAISFDLVEPFKQEPLTDSGLNGDWRCVVIGADGYNITLPNLDSWSVNSQNKVPAVDNKKNGGEWNSFLGTTCFVTVSVSKAEGIKFYKNGLLIIDYPYSDAYVQGFIDAMLPIVAQSGFMALAGTGAETVHGENLIVSSALTATQAQSVYEDYQKAVITPAEPTREVLDIDGGYYTVMWNPEAAAVNTNTAWWTGAFGATTLPEGNNAVQMRYYRDSLGTNNAIQMYKQPSNACGTFYPFGPIKEWNGENDWQKDGTVNFYLNGELNNNLGLVTGNVNAEAGFWTGNFIITFLRYNNTLYVVCDFTRNTGSYHLVAVYKFENITEALTVQLGGYAVGLTGTVAVSQSVAYSAGLPEHDCETEGHQYELDTEETTCTLHTRHLKCKFCEATLDETDLVGVTGHSYTVTETKSGCEVTVTFDCSECTEGDFTVTIAEHSLKKVEKKDATCTETGNYEYWECSECQKKFKDDAGKEEYTDESYVIGKSAHDLQKNEKKDATCTEPGNHEYWECSVCHKKFKTQSGDEEYTGDSHIIQASGHKLDKHDAKEPTCTETGNYEYWECSVCHKKFKAQTGDEEYTGESYLRAKAAHQLTEHGAKAPDCLNEGNDAYWQCENCHQYFGSADDTSPDSEPIEEGSWVKAATGHKGEFTLKPGGAATSEEHLFHWMVCENANCPGVEEACGKELVETSRKSCEEAGTATYKCPVCEFSYTETLPAGEHSWDTGKVTKAASCTETGTTEYTCLECGETKEEVIEKIAHTLTKHEAKEPTCTAAGNYEYWECSACHKKFEAQTGGEEYTGDSYIRAKLAHTLTKHAAHAATCTAKGNTAYWDCSSCHQYFDSETDPDEHIVAENSWVTDMIAHTLTKHEAKEPTCTAAGNYEYWECSACHKKFKAQTGGEEYTGDSYIRAKLAHTLTKHAAHAATCTAKGNTAYWDCSSCHQYFDSETDPDEHIIAENAWVTDMIAHTLTKHEAKEPTCTAAGNYEYWECSVCHKKFNAQTGGEEYTGDSYIRAKLAHTLTEHAAHNATCTEEGNNGYWECTSCHQYFDSEADPDGHVIAEGSWILEKLAHTLSEHARVAATCTQAGTEAYWECSVCHKKFNAQTGGEEITEAAAIPALGHDWTDWTIGADGTETRSCNRCDETETRTNDEVSAFRTAVGAIAGAATAEAKLGAIKTALTAYSALSAAEKTAVAADYATLEGAIADYNAAAEAANAAYLTAADIAMRVLSTALAALGALAAVWAILKRGL